MVIPSSSSIERGERRLGDESEASDRQAQRARQQAQGSKKAAESTAETLTEAAEVDRGHLDSDVVIPQE
eukprot:8637951-Prorocentrum_lima.AAC.1